jgi:hypothetical protein
MLGLRVFTWLRSLWLDIWGREDTSFDRLAIAHPIAAACLVGLMFGAMEWVLAAAFVWILLPFAAFAGAAIVGALAFGPLLIWLRRSKVTTSAT